jgi:acetyl esterase/lipase
MAESTNCEFATDTLCRPVRRRITRPAIVFFFGGAWTNGNVEQFVPQSQYLAQRGMVANVADYRVFGRHITTALESIADAKSAIRWIGEHGTASRLVWSDMDLRAAEGARIR